jgi:hypothetical protein
VKLIDLQNLYKIKCVGVPEKNGFFTGVFIGGMISVVLWAVILYVIF